jgi:hypothetical protein
MVRWLGRGCLLSVFKFSTPFAIRSLVCPQHLAILLIALVFGLVLLAIVLRRSSGQVRRPGASTGFSGASSALRLSHSACSCWASCWYRLAWAVCQSSLGATVASAPISMLHQAPLASAEYLSVALTRSTSIVLPLIQARLRGQPVDRLA